MDITHITSLLGGIALFLYGMSIMGAGLEKLAGGKMQGVLQKLTSSTIKGVIFGTLITGVIVARSEFVEAHPAAVGSFLTAYAASVDWVNANTADAAALIGEYGIVDAAVAEKALPYCNIVCITGAELLEKLPGYLSVLYNADPAAVGGAMPDNSFYFA